MRDIDTGRGVVIAGAEISVRFSRSGGPGGQNVNKRDTRVEVRFDVRSSPSLSASQKRRIASRLGSRMDSAGVLRVVSSSARTQASNRDRAIERLRALLSEALAPPPPPRRATRPTRTAVERRIGEKKRRGAIKRLRRAADPRDT